MDLQVTESAAFEAGRGPRAASQARACKCNACHEQCKARHQRQAPQAAPDSLIRPRRCQTGRPPSRWPAALVGRPQAPRLCPCPLQRAPAADPAAQHPLGQALHGPMKRVSTDVDVRGSTLCSCAAGPRCECFPLHVQLQHRSGRHFAVHPAAQPMRRDALKMKPNPFPNSCKNQQSSTPITWPGQVKAAVAEPHRAGVLHGRPILLIGVQQRGARSLGGAGACRLALVLQRATLGLDMALGALLHVHAKEWPHDRLVTAAQVQNRSVWLSELPHGNLTWRAPVHFRSRAPGHAPNAEQAAK